MKSNALQRFNTADEAVQYLPEEGAVDVGYDTDDFEWWAEDRTASIGVRRTSKGITTRLQGISIDRHPADLAD